MEEIQEREESPRPKDSTPSPSSPHPPQTPQTPQTPQRPAQSADSSKGHVPPKRFHFVICRLLLISLPADASLTSLCEWLLTPPPRTHSPPAPESLTSSGVSRGSWRLLGPSVAPEGVRTFWFLEPPEASRRSSFLLVKSFNCVCFYPNH